jgi:hypothetical protein
MSFTLKVFMHGVVALVKNGEGYRAILPYLPDAKRAGDKTELKAHVATLEHKSTPLLAGLQGYRLTILTGAPGQPLSGKAIEPDDTFKHLTQMQEIIGAPWARLTPGYMKGEGTAVIMDMNVGELGSNVHQSSPAIPPASVDGINGADGYSGYQLASKAIWSVEGLSGPLCLRLEKIASSSPQGGKCEVTISDPGSGGVVCLNLHNVCCSKDEVGDPVDDDFVWYYDMLQHKGEVDSYLGLPDGRYPRPVAHTALAALAFGPLRRGISDSVNCRVCVLEPPEE